MAWAPLGDAAVVVGRTGRPIRLRERRQVAALARLAELRHAELPDG